jgi:cob(I)alamin adenosyltransferase|tara:strand:+ start:205 stop:435 length:231 start_codon:yes stop_codon:yes gene_type:complete
MPLLQAATLVFLLFGAVLMEAAGFGDAVQEAATFAVAGCAGLAALLASLRCACRRASRRIVIHYNARSEALLPVGS